MKKRNICLLNDSFPPEIDGVANAVVNYATQLTAMGDDACVVTPEYPGADDSGFGFPVIRYQGVDVRDSVGYMMGIPFSPQVMSDLQGRKIDLLHSHCPVSSTLLARSIKGVLDAPLVMTYHTKFDIDIAKAVKAKIVQEGAIATLVSNISGCDEVWVVSEGAGENLRSLGYQGEYTVMLNGVDVPRRRLSPERSMELTGDYVFPADVPVFLFVGRLMWYKGIRIILDALAALKSQDIDFRMIFVGGGTDRDEIVAYSESLKLNDKVIFTGPVYDRETLCAWYCRADLFLFPSTFDTNGLVVREAAACGVASVLIKDSCAAEGVTNLRNGFLVEENAASLAVMLTKYAGDRALLRRTGEKAADELYISWADAVAAAAERYEVVIDRYKSGYYKNRQGTSNELLNLSGELMDALAQAQQKRRETLHRLGIDTLRTRLTELAESFDRYL